MNKKEIKEKTKEEILATYRKKVAFWVEKDQPIPELKPLSLNDANLIKMLINKTNKKESIELTNNLLRFLYNEQVCTTEDIMEALEVTYPPVWQRLNLLRKHKLVRREHREYYLATPRLTSFVERHLK